MKLFILIRNSSKSQRAEQKGKATRNVEEYIFKILYPAPFELYIAIMCNNNKTNKNNVTRCLAIRKKNKIKILCAKTTIIYKKSGTKVHA